MHVVVSVQWCIPEVEPHRVIAKERTDHERCMYISCLTFPCTQVEVECGSILMALVQNKIDLIDDSSMTPEEVESLAKKLKLHLFRTSVKENFNVDSGRKYLTFVTNVDYASEVLFYVLL